MCISGGTATIKGTVTAGHKVAADGSTTSYAFTYTVGIKGEGMGDFEQLPVTSPHPTGPIYNGSVATWNTAELVDGFKKYAPGEYQVQLKGIPS